MPAHTHSRTHLNVLSLRARVSHAALQALTQLNALGSTQACKVEYHGTALLGKELTSNAQLLLRLLHLWACAPMRGCVALPHLVLRVRVQRPKHGHHRGLQQPLRVDLLHVALNIPDAQRETAVHSKTKSAYESGVGHFCVDQVSPRHAGAKTNLLGFALHAPACWNRIGMLLSFPRLLKPSEQQKKSSPATPTTRTLIL